jgi:hypothetical protein
MARRRKSARKSGSNNGTLALALVFLALVGINVYVFFFSSRSLHHVSQAAQVNAAGLDEPQAAPASSAAASVAAAQPTRHTDGTIRAREGLGQTLKREGLQPPAVDEVIRALTPVMNFKKDLREGQRYTLETDGAGRVSSFALEASSGRYHVERGADGKLVARHESHKG